jgi:hypothetical protein
MCATGKSGLLISCFQLVLKCCHISGNYNLPPRLCSELPKEEAALVHNSTLPSGIDDYLIYTDASSVPGPQSTGIRIGQVVLNYSTGSPQIIHQSRSNPEPHYHLEQIGTAPPCTLVFTIYYTVVLKLLGPRPWPCYYSLCLTQHVKRINQSIRDYAATVFLYVLLLFVESLFIDRQTFECLKQALADIQPFSALRA